MRSSTSAMARKLSPDGRQQSYSRSLVLHRGSFPCVVHLHCVRSTKGILIEESTTPDTISDQALHLLSEPLPCSRRAMVGTDRLAGPPKSASERTAACRRNRLSLQRDEHKERIQLSRHRRNQQRTQRGMRRGRSTNTPCHKQVGQPTSRHVV